MQRLHVLTFLMFLLVVWLNNSRLLSVPIGRGFVPYLDLVPSSLTLSRMFPAR